MHKNTYTIFSVAINSPRQETPSQTPATEVHTHTVLFVRGHGHEPDHGRGYAHEYAYVYVSSGVSVPDAYTYLHPVRGYGGHGDTDDPWA